MKWFHGIAAAVATAFWASSALAASVSYDFEATRVNILGAAAPAGSAAEFASSAAGATVAGRFTYDTNGTIVNSAMSPDSDTVIREMASVTLNAFAGFTVAARSAVVDGRNAVIDGFVMSGNLGDDFLSILLGGDNTNFASTDFPTSLTLADWSAALFLVSTRVSDGVFADVEYEITSLTAVPSTPVIPLPASAFLLVGGLAGFGVMRRRKTLS